MEHNLSLWVYIYIYRESHQSISDAHESGCDMNKVVLVVRDHSIYMKIVHTAGLKHFGRPRHRCESIFGYLGMYVLCMERESRPANCKWYRSVREQLCSSLSSSFAPYLVIIYWNSVKPRVAKVLANLLAKTFTLSVAFKLLSRACVINQVDRGTSIRKVCMHRDDSLTLWRDAASQTRK